MVKKVYVTALAVAAVVIITRVLASILTHLLVNALSLVVGPVWAIRIALGACAIVLVLLIGYIIASLERYG